jgi:hypothetical protein
MSSSDDHLDWSAFGEREVGLEVELASPAAELAAVLRRYRTELDAARAEVTAERRKGLEALARQAVLAVKLESALALYEPRLADASMGKAHQHLRILKDQMLGELVAAGVELVRLAGRPYEEVKTLVEVEGWLHKEGVESETVLEELEPAVRHGEEVIRMGRVVMGAPLRAAPSQESGP